MVKEFDQDAARVALSHALATHAHRAAVPTQFSSGRSQEGAQLAIGLLSRRRPQLETDLYDALRGGQLRLHYQAQFDLGTGDLVSLEALIRWAHPQEGLLSPGEFLPMAQDAGLMGAIDKWALRAACADGAFLASRGHAVEIAVNVSAARLANEGFVDGVRTASERAGLAPRLLTLELGRQDVLVDLTRASAVALELGAIGVRTSVTNLGVGTASNRDLHLLQLDEMKIDRHLTARLGEPGGDAEDALARLVAAAHRLQSRVVVEGVETDAQYRAAQAAGCDRAQGYLLARPAPLEDLAHVLVRRPATALKATGSDPHAAPTARR